MKMTNLKIMICIVFFSLIGLSAANAQGKAHGKHKHVKEYRKTRHKANKAYNKRVAHYNRENEKYYKQLRKAQLKHLEHCQACNHAFYHNTNYYYDDNVYYSRKTNQSKSLLCRDSINIF